MKKEVVVRPAMMSDLDELVRVENEAWSEEQAFTREHFESHINVMRDYPQCFSVATVNDVVVGIGVAEIIKYDIDNPIPDWYSVTDEGYLVKTFDPLGNVLYGVSLSVSPSFASFHVGKCIIERAKQITRDLNLERFVLGSRIPRYHTYAEKLSVSDYVFGMQGKRFLDPEIEFYSQCGLKAIKILPEYFEDQASLNYGVIVVWENN